MVYDRGPPSKGPETDSQRALSTLDNAVPRFEFPAGQLPTPARRGCEPCWQQRRWLTMTDERKFNPELCLERSAECQRLSKVVIRSEHQVALLHMAETWARLARESMPQESHQ